MDALFVAFCTVKSQRLYSHCGIASIRWSCPCSPFSFTLGLPLTRADEWMQLSTLTHQDPITAKQTTSGFPFKGFRLTSDVCKKKMSIHACFHPLLLYLLQDFTTRLFSQKGRRWKQQQSFHLDCSLNVLQINAITVAMLFDSYKYMGQKSPCLNLNLLAFPQNVFCNLTFVFLKKDLYLILFVLGNASTCITGIDISSRWLYLLLVLDGDARKDCRSAGWPTGLGGSKCGSTSGISRIWHSSG